ncbi:hypothetical protein SMACR_03167 [Sordaria macrospora]|uniref:WGS project CABT00000000 data, contig 2.7 n=2 Tax=Sordaria macrospora TaxID=5147 RepID=F7VU16_SORMK|nr:uncharacterized protein SMAC_03167 [Sordaria macrospora k-hell]KAA8635938.1 hypothetical protein SMACR_03167 [Sordaria macrospora]KAH7632784.1 hypothetical protein B0T09DRAFT_332008 [Sordaria sp. MPI-SDFR-AT-0083]WPJ60742.1 hypothetical protein SMAC4_03167 [Sordaria macrospora]CCC09004.1 unnamed protein product [Sordaria macrospora k-hell]
MSTLRHLSIPLHPISKPLRATFLRRRFLSTQQPPKPKAPIKSAIITGAARGIGRATAHRLAADGYVLTLNDLSSSSSSDDALTTLCNDLQSLGHSAHPFHADITTPTSVSALLSSHLSVYGSLSCMIANAGIVAAAPLLSVNPNDFLHILETNVIGVFNCYRAAAEQFIKQGTSGKLIGASSVAGLRGQPLLGPYATSKFAVRGLTQSFAAELAGEGITANAYAPGVVETGMWDTIAEGFVRVEEMMRKAGKGEKEMEDVEAAEGEGAKARTIKKFTDALVPLKRHSTPEDVAGLVGFLASEGADYITGQTYAVDGGIYFT